MPCSAPPRPGLWRLQKVIWIPQGLYSDTDTGGHIGPSAPAWSCLGLCMHASACAGRAFPAGALGMKALAATLGSPRTAVPAVLAAPAADDMACFARPGVVLLAWTDDLTHPQVHTQCSWEPLAVPRVLHFSSLCAGRAKQGR